MGKYKLIDIQHACLLIHGQMGRSCGKTVSRRVVGGIGTIVLGIVGAVVI